MVSNHGPCYELRRFYYGECEELHADRGRPRYALTNLW
nr:MAG TPA: hypothetical protein [Caudoviricetes sp.]